jgi:hypothetical protein
MFPESGIRTAHSRSTSLVWHQPPRLSTLLPPRPAIPSVSEGPAPLQRRVATPIFLAPNATMNHWVLKTPKAENTECRRRVVKLAQRVSAGKRVSKNSSAVGAIHLSVRGVADGWRVQFNPWML